MEFDESRNGKTDGDMYNDPRNSLAGVKLKTKPVNKLLFSPAEVAVPGYSTVEPS